MNRFSIVGNLVSDPEVRATKAGKDCCAFRVAMDDVTMDGTKTTTYFDCTAWGDLVNPVSKLQKGHRVCVEGKLSTSPYVGKDGKARGNILVSVYNVYSSVKNTNKAFRDEPKTEVKADMDALADIDPSTIPF